MRHTSRFYDAFSTVYDLASPKWYYVKPRTAAIEQLRLNENDMLLSVACGTGQNFEFYQKYLKGSGMVVGIDLSDGMLSKAQVKIDKHNWKNIKLFKCDAANISSTAINEGLGFNHATKFDSAICELGLTAMPEWERVVDNMIKLVNPGGRVVIMDWYRETLDIRARLLNWIGDADITRPTWQYLKHNVDGFYLDRSFHRGDVFVATGTVRQLSTEQGAAI